MEKKLTIQLWVGVAIAFIGIALLIMGFLTPPGGEIHDSVLVAYGEVATFAGSLIGVDYHYRFREYERKTNNERHERHNGAIHESHNYD